MALNLFDNIFDQFTGKAQSQVPTSVPQAPRTAQYVAPNVPYNPSVQKPSMTLFSDEQQMFQKMKADNLSDEQATAMLKKRRNDLLGGDAISSDETKMLLKMQADNLPIKQAVSMIQKRRQDMETKANSIHDLHADEGVVEQTLKAPFRAIGDVASQTWQGIGKGTEGLIDASFRGVNDLNRMIGSSDYSPELEKQLPQGGYLGDVAKIGAGTTGAIFNLGKAPLALGINTANQLPGAQYITQGIGKGIEYGAENIGGLFGVDKDTSMDIATTGMNLLGMKPGMNTLQYGKGIANAPGVMGKSAAIVKPVGESVVQTVKMPYDLAKGTVKLGVDTARKVGPSIATASDAIQTGLNRMNKGEINKFQAEQGVSPGKYLNDRGIVSSGKPIEETLLEQMKASRDQATEGMSAIQGNYKMPAREFANGKIDYMREMLKDNYRKATETLDAEGSMEAKRLLEKYDTEGLTMSEINTSKRKMAENNPVNWLTDSASPRVQKVKRISDNVREWQFEQAEKAGFTNLKEINKQTQAFYKLHEGITKWNDGIEANNKISLTDYLAFDADPTVFVAKKVLSSPYVRQSIVKGLNKISGRVVKPIEKATIDTINTKRAEYDYGNRNSNTGDRMATGKPLALPAPSGKATGAKNFRVNQPKESPTKKSDITSKSIIRRPTTTAKGTKAEVQLAKEVARAKEVAQVEKDLNTALLSKYNPDKQKATRDFIDRAIAGGKITKQEAIQMVENLYENADGFQKPRYEKLLNELYSSKKVETFDDLLNEKQVAKEVKTPRQEFLETPEGIYREINKKANDRRYNPEKANALIAKFKEKTGIDLMKDPLQKFDEKGNVIRTIVKPNSTTNAKQQVSNANASDTIPEGYFKNAFGEIVKNPSNSKGGFIRNPFAKPEPKRLFAGENSAQPPKGKTGWFKGADGKMRFEIDDSGANIPLTEEKFGGKSLGFVDSKGNIPKTLDGYLVHDELFKQYPSLKDVKVKQELGNIIGDKNNLASYNSETNTISLNVSSLNTNEKIKSSLLHEIQHAIQETEGFARGGSVGRELQDWAYNEQSYVRKITKLLQEDLSKIESNPRLKKAFSLLDNEMTKENPNFSKIENEYKDVLKPYQNLSKDIARQKDMEKALDSNDYELYKNLAGEVEARNVQSRMGLTAKERTLKSPESTEDTPRIKQIIRKDNKGLSLSTKVPQNFIDTISKGVDKNGRIDLYNKTGSKVSINIKNTDAIEMAYENGHIYPYNTNIKTLGIKKKTP